MKDTSLFAQLLGVSEPWKVVEVLPDLEEKSISIRIEWPRGVKGHCPKCDKPCDVYDHREERQWRHLDTMQFKTLLICPVPRIECAEHGVLSLAVPWADTKARFTMLFERFAIDILLSTNNKKKAGELLGLSWDEVHHIQERAVKRGLQKRDLAEVTRVGVDEKSFLKGHSYASLLYDLDSSCVLEVVKDRTQESAEELLSTLSSHKDKITAVAVDMWEPFLNAIESTLPESDIVHDKYHIVSHLTKAVDAVRRQENKALKNEGEEDLLKGTRFLWLKNPKNWTEKDEATFEELSSLELKIGRAWSIKETFSKFWDYSYEKSATVFFNKWYWLATHSRLKPIIKVAKMIKNHFENILSYLRHRITNAKAEGMNSKVQIIKATARGFRNFQNYRTAILFHCGGLALHP